jgi:hypothetical protein
MLENGQSIPHQFQVWAKCYWVKVHFFFLIFFPFLHSKQEDKARAKAKREAAKVIFIRNTTAVP